MNYKTIEIDMDGKFKNHKAVVTYNINDFRFQLIDVLDPNGDTVIVVDLDKEDMNTIMFDYVAIELGQLKLISEYKQKKEKEKAL